MLKKFGLLVLCGVSLFAMHDVELNINDKDLEFAAKLDMGQFMDSVEPELVYIGAKMLHADEKHSDLNDWETTDLDDYYEVNFLMQRHIDDTGLSIGLGIKLNGTKKFASIPFGMEVGYKMPFIESVPMTLNANIYYAPDVLTMRDADNFFEYRISYDIEVIKNAIVTMGYRSLQTNYESVVKSPYFKKDINYNASPYVGFKFSF